MDVVYISAWFNNMCMVALDSTVETQTLPERKKERRNTVERRGNMETQMCRVAATPVANKEESTKFPVPFYHPPAAFSLALLKW